MRVVDPGHAYVLAQLDNDDGPYPLIAPVGLFFVKREGEKYPGNVGSYPGTTMQEVFRALIDRCNYLDAQNPCMETKAVKQFCESSIIILEQRAARMHGRTLNMSFDDVLEAPICDTCGHVGCTEHVGGV